MNCKMNITNKLKLWTVITLSLLLVGLILFGVVGYNQSIDYRKSYEVDVKVYSYEDSKTYAEQGCNKYFADNGITVRDYSFHTNIDSDEFAVLKYKFSANDFERINLENLENAANTALCDKNISLVVDVKTYEAQSKFVSNIGYVALALGLAVLAIFVYLFFMEKLVSALSVIISGVISVLLFISIMAIARIPAYPFVVLMEAVSGLLTVVLSAGLVVRFKEEGKNISNSKLTKSEIANRAANASLLRYIVITALLLVGSLLFVIIGSGYMKFLGLQMIVASIVSVFSSIVWTPVTWSLLSKDSKGYKSTAKSVEE